MPAKITFDTVLKIAASLPGIQEGTTYGVDCLKVGGKLLTCPAINKSAEPNSAMFRIDMDQRNALIEEAPDTYYITDHYVNYPCVLVRLSRMNADALRDLLQSAFRFVSANDRGKSRARSRK